MSPQHTRLIPAILLILTLAACATGGISDEEKLLQAGAVRLDAEQVKSHVSGKTEEWRHGGGYYKEDGSLRIKWLKVYSNGTWEVAEDGTLCYEVPRWEKRCQSYLRKDDTVFTLEEGRNLGAQTLYDGDNLNAMGRFNSEVGRNR